MASGIMPTVGVPAGDSRIAGSVSVAPTVAPESCPVTYHKVGCAPPNLREQMNWLIANLVAAQNDCGLNYDCASADQLRELICCLARKCAMLCRSTVTPAPAVWPPVDYSGPFVVDDIAVPAALSFWDCNSNVYETIGGGFDLCADVPVAATDTAQPVYGLQCINGAATRVELPTASASSGVSLYAKERWTTGQAAGNPWSLAQPNDMGYAVFTSTEPGYLNPFFGLPSRIASIVTNAGGTTVTFAAAMPNTNYHIRLLENSGGFPAQAYTTVTRTLTSATLNTPAFIAGSSGMFLELEAYA